MQTTTVMAPGIIIKAVIYNEVDNVYNEHIKVNELSILQSSPDNHVPWEGLEVTSIYHSNEGWSGWDKDQHLSSPLVAFWKELKTITLIILHWKEN